MRKSTLFISAVLTTFVMAMMAGVASAYQNVVNSDLVAAQQPEPQTVNIANSSPPTFAPAEAQSAVVNLSPEEAAALAAQVLGHDDLFSVEVTDLNGETVYLVTFSSGDLVYISLDGQIRAIDKMQVETVIVNAGRNNGGGNRNNDSSSSNSNQSRSRDHDDDDHDD